MHWLPCWRTVWGHNTKSKCHEVCTVGPNIGQAVVRFPTLRKSTPSGQLLHHQWKWVTSFSASRSKVGRWSGSVQCQYCDPAGVVANSFIPGGDMFWIVAWLQLGWSVIQEPLPTVGRRCYQSSDLAVFYSFWKSQFSSQHVFKEL